jgi:uncharacterized protein (TIGR02145 family)
LTNTGLKKNEMSYKNGITLLLTFPLFLFSYTNSWCQITTDWERVRHEREAKEARNRNDAKLQEQQVRDRINAKPGTVKRGSSSAPVEYDFISKTKDVNGIQIVRRYGLYGMVRLGKEIVPPVYYEIYRLSGRFYPFKGTDPENRLVKRIGFMDKLGNIIIPVQFDGIITNFTNGIATVFLNNEKFQIDESGHIIGAKSAYSPNTVHDNPALAPDRIEKKYYESGELMVYRPFVDGQQNGMEKQYSKNGQLSSEIPFKNGKRDGQARFYRDNGQLLDETFYINGLMHGVSIKYHANGKMASKNQYTNGQPSGIGMWYYESGKLRAEQPYVNGKANGFFKEYYENGKMEKQTLFKDDIDVKKEPAKSVDIKKSVKVTEPRINSNNSSVKIKNQVWMSYNLDVITFRNGDSIPEAKTANEWNKAVQLRKPAWCYYNNNPVNKKYGRLYNLYAVEDQRGLAPKGWHIAGDAEWSVLTTNLATASVNTPWRMENVFKSDASGFNDLLSGKRKAAETFEHLGQFSYWWSLSKEDEFTTYIRTYSADGSVIKSNGQLFSGLSVRCIRD